MPGTDITVDRNTEWVKYNPTGFRMNSYDEYALEEALLIKERINKTEVHAISVGPQRTAAVIRKAMEMGADEGIHIQYGKDGYITPYQVASVIASYAKDKHYDIILTGVAAEDDMHTQTGQMIAGMLDYPYATSVMHQEILTGQSLYVEREGDNRSRECIEMTMPCVLTVQSGINMPRYPSLSNILRARQKKIVNVPAEDLGMPESREVIISLYSPPAASKGVFLEGSTKQKAQALLKVLHEKSLI